MSILAVRIVFSNPLQYELETPTGRLTGTAPSLARHGAHVISELGGKLALAGNELNGVRDVPPQDPAASEQAGRDEMAWDSFHDLPSESVDYGALKSVVDEAELLAKRGEFGTAEYLEATNRLQGISTEADKTAYVDVLRKLAGK